MVDSGFCVQCKPSVYITDIDIIDLGAWIHIGYYYMDYMVLDLDLDLEGLDGA